MRVLKVPEDGPKKKLLDAAEVLISQKGFDLVSVRDITGAVKANVAAVNYHFGSREALLDLLVMRLLEPLCEERLKALEKAGKSSGADQIFAAYTAPLSTTASRLKMEEHYFFGLAGRILVLPPESIAPALASLRQNVNERFLAALSSVLPDIPDAELEANWRFIDSGLSQSMVAMRPGDDPQALLEIWNRFATRGFASGNPVKKPKDDDSQEMLFDF